MALIKSRWETVLAIYLCGMNGLNCVIQRKGSKYRVSIGQDDWELFSDLRKAAERATQYQSQFNNIDSHHYVDAVDFFKKINWL